MFATLKAMYAQHQNSVAQDRRRERKARPTLQGLERREAPTAGVASLAVAVAPASPPVIVTALINWRNSPRGDDTPTES